MPRRTLVVLVTAFVLVAAPLDAQAPALASADFGALASLVGHCWTGTFPDGRQTDEHCFEWMLDRHFIRDRHVVRGGAPYAGESIYRWDAATKQLAFQYFNSEGQLMTGHGVPTTSGIDFLTSMPSPTGDVELKAAWTRIGPDGFRIWNGQRDGAGWKELWTMEMTRTK
jgi:hypothetical protein